MIVLISWKGIFSWLSDCFNLCIVFTVEHQNKVFISINLKVCSLAFKWVQALSGCSAKRSPRSRDCRIRLTVPTTVEMAIEERLYEGLQGSTDYTCECGFFSTCVLSHSALLCSGLVHTYFMYTGTLFPCVVILPPYFQRHPNSFISVNVFSCEFVWFVLVAFWSTPLFAEMFTE